METITFFDVKDSEKSFLLDAFCKDFVVDLHPDALLSTSQLSDETKSSQIISVFTSSRLSADVLSQFPNLKMIAARSVGYSHIDLDYCDKKGIVVANTPHYGDYTIAEFSFGLLLSLVRKISEAQIDLKNGKTNQKYNGVELFNKTIGIIGLGAIGAKALKIAKGFSMNVLAFDVYKNEKLMQEFDFEYVDLDYLCQNSDIISLYAPATKENYHMIDADRIKKMKNGVIIVNTARGELIDTQALYSALLDKKVSAAALDVLECEEALSNQCKYFKDSFCVDSTCMKKTLINHKLLSMQNVIVTPHAAYDTKEAVQRILESTVKNITEFYSGEDISNKVLPLG